MIGGSDVSNCICDVSGELLRSKGWNPGAIMKDESCLVLLVRHLVHDLAVDKVVVTLKCISLPVETVAERGINVGAEPGPFLYLCCGTFSGALGATCVYPLQLIRTRYVLNFD